MSKEKGFLTKEQENAYADLLDDCIKAKGPLELVDGFAARILIGIIDNELIEKQIIERHAVDPVFITNIQLLGEFVLEKDWEKAAHEAAEIVNTLVNIPGLDEDSEAMIFVGLFMTLAGAIKAKQNNS